MSFSSDKALLANQLPLSVDFPAEFDKFREIFTDLYKRMVNSINTKEGGLYTLQEFYSFNQFFNIANTQSFRNVYRTTYDLVNLNGAPIPAGGTVVFPHNITGIMSATRIMASCTNTDPKYFTVVYPDIYLDAVNINFTNPTGSPLTSCYVIAEYLKN